jgi:hypothetical protein
MDIDMDDRLAWQIVRVSFRTSGELQDLLVLLKEQCSPEEYQDYAAGIARAIDSINDALLNAALASHPEFAARIEADLEKFGRVL